MKRLAFAIVALTFLPHYLHADRYNPTGSPFSWSILVSSATNDDPINKAGESSHHTYEKEEFNAIVQMGVSHTELKVRCEFKFESEMDALPDGTRRLYSERLWPRCEMNKVEIATNAVGCSYNPLDPKSAEFESDSTGIYFSKGWSHLKISIRCDGKPINRK